ncbi:MAG: tetratricopeptide repeat protein [Planctomycetota bacterium]|nr:tetratricopeptide repeat protein [Planctomycetota bacterium]MDA1262643.1 tetratricopeptide repeat protein [Planctomycetota bacterium]
MDCHTTVRWIAFSFASISMTLMGCQGPRSTEQSIDLGNHYLEFGEWQKAANEFKPVTINSPGLWQGEYGYGVAMSQLGDLVTARRCLETANDQSPGNMEIIQALAEVMYRQSDNGQLFQLLRGAGASLGRTEPYLILGLYAIKLKDNDSAILAFQSAIEVDSGAVRPRTTEPYYQLAMLQLSLGNKAEATRRLRQAYGISPADPRVIQSLQSEGVAIDAASALPPGI